MFLTSLGPRWCLQDLTVELSQVVGAAAGPLLHRACCLTHWVDSLAWGYVMGLENMDEVEKAWVDRFTRHGGEPDKARETYRRMREAAAAKPSLTSTPDQTVNQDQQATFALFDNMAPVQASESTEEPKLARPTKKADKQPPVRRGRRAVNWNDRPKTQAELDLFHLSMDIEEQTSQEASLSRGAMATAMIYASLPHSKIEGAVFKRNTGTVTLTVLNDPDIGLPYGKLPRLITAFLCTQAKLNSLTMKGENARRISLGKSQNEFAKKLGLTTGGGERGDITRLKDQAKRLLTSRITLVGQPGSEFHWQNVNIADKGMLLWNPMDSDAKSQWDSSLLLSEQFYEESINHSVPIDLRVLHALRSPLAIDIYVWLTYRYNAIREPKCVSWDQLRWQFGASYADDEQGVRNFVSNFKKQLRAVKAVYREARFEASQHSLMLLPSPPHVIPRS